MSDIDYDKLSDCSEKKLDQLLSLRNSDLEPYYNNYAIFNIIFEKSLIEKNNGFSDVDAFYWYLFYEYLLSFGKEEATKRIKANNYIKIDEILESEWYKNYLIRKEGCLDITQID